VVLAACQNEKLLIEELFHISYSTIPPFVETSRRSYTSTYLVDILS